MVCNTIQPLLTLLACDLKLGFLDDVTLGGQVDRVATAVAEIAKVGGQIG